MRGAQASRNFRCIKSKYMYCYKDCSSAWACINRCDSSKNCQKGQRDFTVNCPTSWAANTDIYADIPYQLTYVLTNEAKFFSEISEKYGIQKDWIEFGDHRSRIANCCHYAGADVNKCDKKKSIWWHGWPLLKDINIPNPKDVFSDSCDK
ncbi:hypothetical protein LY78DRAFT_41999 [Colletotrichum sublineola]|nr:hypothetical protein LY78DRAFT_41999 [Colletotrichum sublineola]